MKIFFTGATGYVGAASIPYLIEQGHEVTAWVRNPEKAQALLGEQVAIKNGALSDTEALAAAMKGNDAVIHAAAYSAVYTRESSLYEKINTTGTAAVLEAARISGIRTFLYISSAGALGPSMNGNVVDENSKRSIPFFNEYERSKAKAEAMVLACQSNMRCIVLNLSRVYGPGLMTEANAATRLIRQIALNGLRFVPGSGEQTGGYVFIEDVAAALHGALNHGKAGQRYIISHENLSFREFFNEVMKQTDSVKRLIRIPVPLLLGASYAFKFGARLGFTPPITPEWAKRYLYDWKLSGGRAARELQFSYTPFPEGIRKTLAWLRAQQASE